MSAKQDQQYLEQLDNIDFQPVFILGLHRSGTSILYKMLTATECFNPIIAYHLIRYNQLLSDHVNSQVESSKKELTDSFKEKGLEDRGIDRLQITADFAEEYGFLLGQRTSQMYLNSKNLPLFIEMGKKIQFISENDKPILLKNPYDFSNFLYIKQVFPNAKFVFIHRHPFKTLSSAIKAIRFLLHTRNPYTSSLYRLYNKLFENPALLYLIRLCFTKIYPIGMIFLTLYTTKAAKYYLKNINKLSRQDYTIITYEDLCKNPHKNIDTIMKFFNLKPKQTIDFRSYIKPRKKNLDIGVIHLHRFIYKCMKKYFISFEYKPDL